MDHREMFSGGYNCAESVLAGVTASMSCIQAASGFGGGVGRSGGICGAVTGAVMALGLELRVRDEGSSHDYAVLQQLVARLLCEFEGEFGSLLCRELTSYDLIQAGDREAFDTAVDGRKRCAEYVDRAVRMARDLLDGAPGKRA